MFERYTERARRVIFFARYEASQLGSNSIETEHLLLGLIREGKGLTSRIFSKSHLSMESIRKEIEGRALYRDKVSTSVDIPLSSESKRVLGYASEEAERMLHNYIGTEHILLGLMREEKSVAAGILGEKGMRLSSVREDIVQLLNEKANVGKTKETPLLSEFSRDLTEAAARGALDPLVGRDEELARIVQVLCRRTRKRPSSGSRGWGRRRWSRGWPTRSCRATSRCTWPRSASSPSTSPSSWRARSTAGSSRSGCFGELRFVPLTEPLAGIFGLQQFVPSLALMVACLDDGRCALSVWCGERGAAGPHHHFRRPRNSRTPHVLTSLWHAQHWLVPRGNLLTPAGWQAILGGAFIGKFFLWAWVAFVRPPVFRPTQRTSLRPCILRLRLVASGLAGNRL